ncbi:class I SAM-dependent methyltransferase [Rhizobium sp. ZPR3]|uniref:Class I SAM-dependent methyltransferase n=2 Tax=unclassified Rhizobium TaxID=2613769 RepID=A0AAU7SAP1_9HYPH
MIELAKTNYKKLDGSKFWIDTKSNKGFGYNDGDEVETRIYEHVSACQDRSVFSREIANGISDWASFYHLSSLRANLLRPIVDLLGQDILEVGAGCGAITRFLGESGKKVIAVEGSARRAAIAAERCSDLPGVQVLAANFADIPAEWRFDTILFVGVLEYSRQYFRTDQEDDPVQAALRWARALLKPSGRLVIAIENQLGLKYFAGYKEDHVGEAFFGIEDRYASDGVVTFGRKELLNQIEAAGFSKHRWWFPFPDYKSPVSVISEEALSDHLEFDAASLCAKSVLEDRQKPATSFFALQESWKAVCRNGLLPDLANSFLVVSSNTEFHPSDVVAYHFGTDRGRNLSKVVKFKPIDGRLIAVRELINPRPTMSDSPDVVLTMRDEPYVHGRLWQDRLSSVVSRKGWELNDIVAWADTWWSNLLDRAGYRLRRHELSAHSLLDGIFIDAIPRNFIGRDGNFEFIDQEWSVPVPIEAGYLLFRGLSISFLSLEVCEEPASTVSLTVDQLVLDVAYRLGLWLARADVVRFKDIERQFQERACGTLPKYVPEKFGVQTLPVKLKLEGATALHEEVLRLRAALQKHNLFAHKDFQDVAMQTVETEEYLFSILQRDNWISELSAKINVIRMHQHALLTKISALRDSAQLLGVHHELSSFIDALFSEKWYLEKYPDVAGADIPPITHYLLYGINEGRLPHPMWA